MKRGISLVALVITIIVLIILTTTIIVMFSDGGILGKSEEAVFKSDFSNILDSFMLNKSNLMLEKLGNVNIENTADENKIKENIPLLQNNNKLINSHKYTELIQINENKIYQSDNIVSSNNDKDKEISRWLSEIGIDTLDTLISVDTLDTSISENGYVGYYADVDANGTVDGVIYYQLKTVKNPKKYLLSKEEYSGPFGTNKIISPAGEGNDSFYVMALSDIDSNKYYWYWNAYGNIGSDWENFWEVVDETKKFGKGKDNTEMFMESWKENKYGEKDNNDLWNAIEDQVNSGWYLPSHGEWLKFLDNLGVEKSDFVSKGLSEYIWTSSLHNAYDAIVISSNNDPNGNLGQQRNVRLGTNF